MRRPKRESFFYKNETVKKNELSQREALEMEEAKESFEEAITDFTTSVARNDL
jgi:hypothetical protein